MKEETLSELFQGPVFNYSVGIGEFVIGEVVFNTSTTSGLIQKLLLSE
jgi:hypothetical protein